MFNKKPTQDLVLFLRQLALLTNAGIPIITSTRLLANYQTNLKLRKILQEMTFELLKGNELHACMRNHTIFFDQITCQLIKIGEHSGKLSTMLTMVADSKEKQSQFFNKAKQALIYPAFIIIMSLIVCSCLFFYVIPKFADLFQDKLAALPIFTRFLFAFAFFLQTYCYFFIVPILILLLLFLPLPLCLKLRQQLYQMIYTLPWLAHLIQKIEMIQFARQLSILFSAGLPLLLSLQLINESGSVRQAEAITSLYQSINQGMSLHRAMLIHPYFSDLTVHIVKLGEETGKLDLMLEQISLIYENEIEQNLSRIISLIEPLIMTILGALIGVIVIGMYIPLFKLGTFLT